MLKEFLEAGKIVGTHGIKGELRVEPWCDSPEFFAQLRTLYFNAGAEKVEITASRVHKNLVLVQLQGVSTIEQADTLRGKVLYLRRGDVTLPKDRYFIADLIGMQVYHANNEDICYGTLTDVLKTGANDVYQITGENEKNYLIPVIDQVVIETDIPGRRLRILPMKGMFDDAD